MIKGIVDLQTALAIALASIPALVTVLWSMWQHNKRVEDVRDLLRSEIKSSSNEILINLEKTKQEIQIVSTKFSNLEQDVKRSLIGIDSINHSSKEFIRSIAEHNVKLDIVNNEITDHKKDKIEIRQNLSNFQKIVVDLEKSLSTSLETFELRLIEIEKKYSGKIAEQIEQLKKNASKGN
ncbi:hypothetical protein [Fibrivirga algicola]|uniref:Uncharacterized protein n=1 Tax=Fibrivirga algicola TaxID=2950420 RepID=A0ABX0QLX1_9BACT|nr:hypothetical protein [Fibrivirga algicola]NID13445.1 hypothetical protein [Fibrivirga algicola]